MKKCRVVVCRETYFHVDIEAEDRHQAMDKAEKLIKAGVDIEKYIHQEDVDATVVVVNHAQYGEPVEKVVNEEAPQDGASAPVQP